jgi:aerobic carbon-monoxide dehydrogenase large subunit
VTQVATRAGETAARLGAIGRAVARKEDPSLLRGEGRFVDDLQDVRALEVALLRSPHPHARIARLDPGPARRVDGVVEVLVASDLPDGGSPIPMRMFSRPGMERFLQRPLAGDTVR